MKINRNFFIIIFLLLVTAIVGTFYITRRISYFENKCVLESYNLEVGDINIPDELCFNSICLGIDYYTFYMNKGKYFSTRDPDHLSAYEDCPEDQNFRFLLEEDKYRVIDNLSFLDNFALQRTTEIECYDSKQFKDSVKKYFSFMLIDSIYKVDDYLYDIKVDSSKEKNWFKFVCRISPNFEMIEKRKQGI